MFYYAIEDAESGIMVTASHNPKEYNGFKLYRENAIPISENTGIKDIKQLVQENNFPEAKKGKITKKDVMDEFVKRNLKFVETNKSFKIVVDAGNGMCGFTYPKIFEKIPSIKLIPLYFEIDFNFPNHESNPLKLETLKDLQKKVIKEKADLGIATDGDGDRCTLVDEKGKIVTADFITALVAQKILKKNPGSKILYDLRSSQVVKEYIKKHGGKPIMTRVGHVFIKEQMRKEKAVFAGELSGHFYYKECKNTESSFITAMMVMNLLADKNKKLSELVNPLRKYFQSSEINSEVKDKDAKLKELEEIYKDANKILHLDGISIYYDDWWCNIRPSNTEPLLRLNVEANTKELMEEKTKELLAIIRE